MKRKIFSFICKLLKVGVGEIPPEWLTWIFYPMKKYAARHAFVRYDFVSDVYTINGVKISGGVFESWGKNGIKEGSFFELLKRKDDGMIYVKEYRK